MIRAGIDEVSSGHIPQGIPSKYVVNPKAFSEFETNGQKREQFELWLMSLERNGVSVFTHLSSEVITIVRPYICTCGDTFSYKEEFRKHFTLAHLDDHIRDGGEGVPIICHRCGEVYILRRKGRHFDFSNLYRHFVEKCAYEELKAKGIVSIGRVYPSTELRRMYPPYLVYQQIYEEGYYGKEGKESKSRRG